LVVVLSSFLFLGFNLNLSTKKNSKKSDHYVEYTDWHSNTTVNHYSDLLLCIF